MSVWNNPEFAAFWNKTYGLDMSGAPIRPGVIYPLIDSRVWQNEAADFTQLRLVDFGCGNGNLIRALQRRPFSEWVGIDNGSAILDTANYLRSDRRIHFLNNDIGQAIPEICKDKNFDHAISVFTLEEIPLENMGILFNNMASAVCGRQGYVHIFTQHPAYALQQDLAASLSGEENTKFYGHKGYFDTAKSTYRLSVMNAEKGFPEMANYYHKPLGAVVSALADAHLSLREMIEIPNGVNKWEELENRTARSGDVPRFLYLRARYQLG